MDKSHSDGHKLWINPLPSFFGTSPKEHQDAAPCAADAVLDPRCFDLCAEMGPNKPCVAGFNQNIWRFVVDL